MKFTISISHDVKKKALIPHFLGFDEINGEVENNDASGLRRALKIFLVKIKDEKILGISEVNRVVSLKLNPTVTISFRDKNDTLNEGIYYGAKMLLPLLLNTLTSDEIIQEVAEDIIIHAQEAIR